MSFRFKPSVLAVIGALAAGGSTAFADSTLREVVVSASAESAERADGPVQGYRATRSASATRTDTPLKEVPQSITVVSEDLIEDLAMRSIADVVRYVPGVSAAQGEGNRDQLVIRGANTTADFYLDGVRDDAQIFRDLYNLERVEILKGPAGMIFGRGGAGGVVNRVSKKPLFARTSDAEFTLGTESQVRAAVDLGNKVSDHAAWRLNAMAESADSFRNGVELERYAVNPTLTLMAGERTAVTLSIEHAKDERTADRGLPSQNGRAFVTDEASFFGNADQSRSQSTVNGVAVIVDHDFGGGTLLKNQLRATQYDKFYQNVYAGGAVNASGIVSIAAYNNSNERTNVFNQTDLTTRFSTGSLEHTLLAGAEFGRQRSDSRRLTGFFDPANCLAGSTSTSCRVSAANPFATVTAFRASGSDADNFVEADVAAVYLQDQVALTRSLKIIGGLRHDRFKVEVDDRRTLVTPTDLSRTDRGTSPRLGLIWSPTAATTLYASYSDAMLPSAEQLSLTTGTAELEPEKARNLEVGARVDLTPNLTLSAAAFELKRQDVRIADPARPGFFVKTGETSTEGYEIGLQGKLTPSWEVFAGYAELDATITQATSDGPAGRKLGLVPERSAALWNKLALGGGFSIGLGLIYQSDSFASISNAVTLPSYTRADGAVYYAFADGKTRLALNVENLSDKSYYATAHSDNNISPGAPRNARLTLATKF